MRLEGYLETFFETRIFPTLNLYDVMSLPVKSCSWRRKSNVLVQKFVSNHINPFVPNASFLYPLKKGGREKVHWEQVG